MSQKPNFFKIGLFVILALLILAGGIIFFGGAKFFEKKVTIETYFDQSVQGLSVGSALQFQGVQIGNVSYIGFVFNEYKTTKQYVLVRAEIYGNKVAGKGRRQLYETDKERREGFQNMIKQGLRLQLASQGITGVAFLNAVYLDPERYPPLEHDWKPEYMYIPSAPGTITQITETIEDLAESIDKIDFKEISEEIEKLVVSLNKAVEDAKVGELSKNLSELIESLNGATTELNTILKSKDTKETITNINAITSDLKNTLNRTDRLLSSREHSVRLTLENIERISEDLRELTETMKKYPSWVLFGNPPPHIEEEEKPE
jgi:phospholipid/cholesterol/gamma-HCH transport system substrate-binding protein/paraquat-inducible protein B